MSHRTVLTYDVSKLRHELTALADACRARATSSESFADALARRLSAWQPASNTDTESTGDPVGETSRRRSDDDDDDDDDEDEEEDDDDDEEEESSLEPRMGTTPPRFRNW